MFVFKVGVVGAGAIGAELAHVVASAGFPVVLKDVDDAAVQRGVAHARGLWQARVDAGKLDAAEGERLAGLITGTAGYDAFGDVDFVVEALPEDLELKQTVLAELDEVTPGHAILASTTSSLSISELALVTGRPERVVGFHVFHPASSTRLVEVVEGDDTSLETAQAAVNLAQAIRRLPIRCGDAPGFVIDRVLAATGPSPPDGASDDASAERFALKGFVEACLVLDEGEATMRDIDLGLAAGAGIVPPPLQRADGVGLDVMLTRLQRAAEEWGPEFEPPTILRRLVTQGRLGTSVGQGFFPHPRPDAGWEERPIKLESRGEVAIAWLDRPPANSLSPEVVATLVELFDHVSASGEVRALVIASANPALFCAGADIKAFTRMDEAAGRALLDDVHGVLRAMETSRIVTIAAVNAVAVGGGCELAMACDVRIAAESASFGQPEINLGIIPGFGGTQRLPRLVGEARALELNLTGDPIAAEEAYEYGLVTRVVPDHELLDTALQWARKLAGQAPIPVQEIKRVSAAGDIEAGIEAEKRAFLTAFTSEDAHEGIAAFLGKRAARWQGR